jgi:hypothetical protein
VSDLLNVALPTLGALFGSYLGVQWRARSVEKQELRQLLDECAAVLARADQRRGGAYVRFLQDGVNTSELGIEAVIRFREELSVAEQLRDRLRFRTREGSAVFKHFFQAVEALGEVSVALGAAVALPADALSRVTALEERMSTGEEDFKRERAAFLQAAQTEVAPRTAPGLRAWRRGSGTQPSEPQRDDVA